MRFHFCMFNHHPVGRQTLHDMYVWLKAGLEELGYPVTLSADATDPAAINILWECFEHQDIGVRLATSGLTYGIIVTEFMDGAGFNRGTPQSDAHDRRDERYRARWNGFQAAAQGAKFFWSMVESNVGHLRAHAPASFVELGFSDRLVPSHLAEPDIDFSFTGIVTPHRRRLLDELSARARVVWHGDLLPIEERDRLFHATRINLSPNKTSDWQMPSPIRVGMALLSQRGIALDRTPQATRQSRLVGACPEGMGFVEFALSKLRQDWRREARIGFERYRGELPMQRITERLLDECLLSG